MKLGRKTKRILFGSISIGGILAWFGTIFIPPWLASRNNHSIIVYGHVYVNDQPAINAHIIIKEGPNDFVQTEFDDRTNEKGYFSGNLKGSGKGMATVEIELPDTAYSKNVELDFLKDSIEIGPFRSTVAIKTIQPNQPPKNERSVSTEKKPTPAQSAKVDGSVLVLAFADDKFMPALTTDLTNWASALGSFSREQLKTELVSNTSFNSIIDGNIQAAKNLKLSISPAYLCLLKCSTVFSKSSINESLIKGSTSWSLLLINTQTSEIVLSESDVEVSSSISEHETRKRNYDGLFNSIKTKKISLQ